MFNEIDGPAELARIAARYIVSGGRAIGIKVIHSSFSQRPVHQGSDSTVRIDKSQPRGGVVENKRAGIEERDDYKTAEEMQVRIDGPDIHEELLFSSLGCSVRISTWSTNSRALAGSPIETIRLRGEIVGRSYVGAIPPNPRLPV